jgi:hypothetical protein
MGCNRWAICIPLPGLLGGADSIPGVDGNAPDVTAWTGGNSSELLELPNIGGRNGEGCMAESCLGGRQSSSRERPRIIKRGDGF